MTLSCLCGAVLVHVGARPDHINECNCRLCSGAGARWAYFDPSKVVVEGETKGFRRRDKDRPNAEIRFCADCGSTTHFVLTDHAIAQFGNALMGVNMRLADEEQLTGIELRYPDGRHWPGFGPFSYTRDARIIGQE